MQRRDRPYRVPPNRPPRAGVTFWAEVTELDEAPLDPKTFASPVGFHLVLALPNHRPYTFLDTLRADWASLECLNDVTACVCSARVPVSRRWPWSPWRWASRSSSATVRPANPRIG